ncbi:MAG TPA: metal-dependent transcriptional regulator [Anaeromyxobacteraceae bacterium]|nr:metal-dependent transcriptional regulator [Anaeromyxobacteraceae bacterium]
MSGMEKRRTEEILEAVFAEAESGRADRGSVTARLGDHAPGSGAADFQELAAMGLLVLEGDQVQLTPEGEERARGVVRRHRLAERLFRDLLDLSENAAESQACEFEHILSPEATDSVCTLLGHPPTCPHGKAIPQGPCCSAASKAVRPLVTGLPHFPIGETGRIVFIAPRFHDRMDKLAALGVVPGSEVHLHQRSPAFVLEIGETTVAIDPEIAGEIFVKRVERR